MSPSLGKGLFSSDTHAAVRGAGTGEFLSNTYASEINALILQNDNPNQ